MAGAWDGPVYRDGAFVYDDRPHLYYLNDKVIPGVSTILTPIVDFGDAPREKVVAASIRGKAVHRAAELWDEGDLDEESLDPVLVPYLAGWKKFRRDYECEWTHMELPEYHKTLLYGATLDRRGRYKGKRIVVDLKATYKLNDSVEVQLSGYDLIDEAGPADELWSVRVTRDGDYERHVHKPCHALFLSLLNVYRWRDSKGLKYAKW